jgi:prepilin-type N-terminal cleavage/methylation domain-containing protein
MRNEKGFTLLEVIVAMAILATGFLAVVQLFSGGARLASASDEYLRGVALAQHKFTQLELKDFQSDETSGEFENDPAYRWSFEQEPYASPLNDSANGIQLSQVTLTVTWDGPTEERTIRLTSLKTDGEIRPAPDTVHVGNVASLAGGGGGSSASSLTSTSSSNGFNPTVQNNNIIKAPVGPGAIPAPAPGTTPQPAVDPNLKFDISGMPLNRKSTGPAPKIGVTQ